MKPMENEVAEKYAKKIRRVFGIGGLSYTANDLPAIVYKSIQEASQPLVDAVLEWWKDHKHDEIENEGKAYKKPPRMVVEAKKLKGEPDAK